MIGVEVRLELLQSEVGWDEKAAKTKTGDTKTKPVRAAESCSWELHHATE